MDAAVLLNTNDVAEVDIQQHMYGSVGHVLAPEKLAKGFACAPEDNPVVGNAIFLQYRYNGIA